MEPKVIGVYPESAFMRLQNLFTALSTLEPVSFRACSETCDKTVSAMILVGVSKRTANNLQGEGIRALAFVTDGLKMEARRGANVQFSSSVVLDPVLRGQCMSDESVSSCLDALPPGYMTLASVDGRAIWARSGEQRPIVDLLAVSLPSLDESPFLFHYLCRERFMSLLPLIHFIREVIGESSWQRTRLRACFMFDDPNLHWPSFGHIGYAGLAESARRHNYHVSFATVPLDAWFIHRPTAMLLRENKERLSFLVHGNNHTRLELARIYQEPDCLRLAAQALRRIERFEERSQLEVARVMAAPHGACNWEMATALLRLGFEAACISRGSIMSFNRDINWPKTVGLNPAEFLGEGLPVIPRFALAADRRTDIVLAAYLRQPIIPVGHHQDVSDGYGLLEELAGFINALGPVDWTDIREIARSNFLGNASDGVVRVRTYARRFRLDLPAGIRKVEIEHAWRREGDLEAMVVIEGNGRGGMSAVKGDTLEIAMESRGLMEISYRNSEQVDFRSVPNPRRALWPIVRRVLAETRDRLHPWLAKWSGPRKAATLLRPSSSPRLQ